MDGLSEKAVSIAILYSRYLVHVAPLYLGGLMLAHGFVCFVAALCTKVRMQWILTLLSLFVLLGGSSIVIFTFGFKIVLTLAQVSGITLLLSCAYELVTHLNYRRSSNGDMEREKKTPNAILIVTITATIRTTLTAVVSPTKKIEKTSIVDVVNAGLKPSLALTSDSPCGSFFLEEPL